jgi:hypothetical protein
MANAPHVYPVTRRFIGVGAELNPGTPVVPTFTLPLTAFTPVDKITYLQDKAWRNAMAGLYNMIPGPIIGDLSLAGPFFADSFGYLLNNIMGDYYVSGMTNPGSSQTSVAAYPAGTTSITLTTGTLTLNIPYLFYMNGSSGPAEVIVALSGTGAGPYVLSRPLYYPHVITSTLTASTVNSLYTHNFSLLNSGTGAGGAMNAQPVTHTFTDYTGITAVSGARQYAFTCLSDVTLMGTSTALITFDAKAQGLASQIAAQAPTSAVSAAIPQAAWTTSVQFAGAQVFNISEWKLTITRKLEPIWTDQGQQSPYAIPRGELTAACMFMFDPALDESQFLYYLNNTQPTMQISTANGLPGTKFAALTINAQLTAFDSAALDDKKSVFGYNQNALLVANTTNAGFSGGYSPLSLTIQNSQPSY